MSSSIEILIDLSWDAVVARRDVRTGVSVSRPAFEPLGVARLESRFSDEFPVLDHLDSVLELAAEHELADLACTIGTARGQIRWSQNAAYDETSVSRELLDGYAYGVLSGPDGLVTCEVPLCGYLMMGPNLTYKDHQHAPREIYLVLTPGTQWSLDSGEWFDVAAGDLIVHEPWQMHAMRTGDQPMIAFAAWLEKGDRTAITI